MGERKPHVYVLDHPYETGIYKVGSGTYVAHNGDTHRALNANSFSPTGRHHTLHLEFTTSNRAVEVGAHNLLEKYRIYKDGRATEWFRCAKERVIRAVEDAAEAAIPPRRTLH